MTGPMASLIIATILTGIGVWLFWSWATSPVGIITRSVFVAWWSDRSERKRRERLPG